MPAPFPPARTLIVYFSFTGNTQTVARLLQQHTGATLMALERPAEDLLGLGEETDFPEPLEPDQIQLSDFDLIFLGFPIWTEQLPVAVEGWLTEHPMPGKTIAPFCTHSGAGPGQAFETLETLCSGSTLLPPLALLGGIEEDGVLYPLEDEQLAEAERQLLAWSSPLVTSAC